MSSTQSLVTEKSRKRNVALDRIPSIICYLPRDEENPPAALHHSHQFVQ